MRPVQSHSYEDWLNYLYADFLEQKSQHAINCVINP